MTSSGTSCQPWMESTLDGRIRIPDYGGNISLVYSNIKHEVGISCIKKFLDKDREISETQKQFLLDAIRFILEYKYFTYNNEIYQQCKCTAMGTKMAPSYANLFMGALEKEYIWGDIQYCSKKIVGVL